MNDSPNFASILDESPDEIARPKPLPAGNYTCVVQGPLVYDKSSKKGTPFVEFTLRPIATDVDEHEISEMGGIDGKTIRATFYLTEDAVYRLDEFHEHCGIDLDDGQTRRQRNEEAINAQVMATIKHEMSPDGTQVYAKLSRTAKAD